GGDREAPAIRSARRRQLLLPRQPEPADGSSQAVSAPLHRGGDARLRGFALRPRRRAIAMDRFAKVAGLDLRYRVQGDGPALVLVHGVGSHLESWDGVAAALADGYRVVSF